MDKKLTTELFIYWYHTSLIRPLYIFIIHLIDCFFSLVGLGVLQMYTLGMGYLAYLDMNIFFFFFFFFVIYTDQQ